MDEDEKRVGQDVDIRERDEHPGEDREHEERTAHGENRLVGEPVGDLAPRPVEDDVHDLAEDAESDNERDIKTDPLQHVDRKERRREVDGEVPRAEEDDQVPEVEVRKRLPDGGEEAVLPTFDDHPGLGRADEDHDPGETGDEPEEEEDRVAVGCKVREDCLPRVDEETCDEADDERNRCRKGQPVGEEGSEPVLRYEVPHPGVPAAVGDRREGCVESY
ncbi:hypothetical protein DSECCO2_598740 [anaerobic digester metagenome]